MIKPDIWTGCYLGTWKNNIVDEAFSHPAKVSFSLAGKIYNHALKMGWIDGPKQIKITKEILELIKKELDLGLYLRL